MCWRDYCVSWQPHKKEWGNLKDTMTVRLQTHFTFVTSSCVFLIITATYSFCSLPRMASKNFIHFIYRALPVNFTQACADNELAWPFTETGWMALHKAFSLNLSTPVLLLVRADSKKVDKVCCLGSIASCLQHFWRVGSCPPHSPLYLLLLEQCLAHSKWLITMSCMNKWRILFQYLT